MRKKSSIQLLTTGLVAIACFLTGCVSKTPYVSTNLSNSVELKESTVHAFEYVKIEQQDGELTVYGKVHHNHINCAKEGYVDVTVVTAEGNVSYTAGLVLVKGSNKVKGWHGAAFRGRLKTTLNSGDVVRLSFHAEKCHESEVIECSVPHSPSALVKDKKS